MIFMEYNQDVDLHVLHLKLVIITLIFDQNQLLLFNQNNGCWAIYRYISCQVFNLKIHCFKFKTLFKSM